MDDAKLIGSGIQVQPRNDRFDAVTISMHWASLLLLVAIFAAAWPGGNASSEAAADSLLLIHRSAGVLLWALTLARLAWKYSLGRPAALPPTMGRAQRTMARANEYGLYGLLALQPITGFLQSALRGRPFPLLGFTFPALVERHRGLTKIFHGTHEVGAWALLILIGLHAAAALFHHFVLRDGVLRAMLPARRRA